MKQRLQNKVAESRHTLPIAIIYGTVVWLLAGLVQERWWLQYGCFLLSVLLMMELNNRNLLIRIYSRSVSVTFIFLFCAAVFMFSSLSDAIVEVCSIASLILLFDCYQDKTTVGQAFYMSLLIGLGSIVNVFLLIYIPVIWLLMAFLVFSLSWRTFMSSLLGVVTPYWFLAGWDIYQNGADFTIFFAHFAQLAALRHICHYEVMPPSHLVFYLSVVLLLLIGSIHFLRKSTFDKIRVRQVYYSFMILAFYTILILVLYPQQSGLSGRLLIIATSPLFGHFMALTRTKFTNIAVCFLTIVFILLTAINLWVPSLVF